MGQATHDEFLEGGLAQFESERRCFEAALSTALLEWANQSVPVYLERLGILVTTDCSTTRTRIADDHAIIQEEMRRKLSLEKCLELTRFHRERYPNIVETPELARRVSEILSEGNGAKPTRSMQASLRSYWRAVCREVIVSGSCDWLPAIGTFYALHNRQGEAYKDWFAGADLFLKSDNRFLEHSIGRTRVVRRPVLRNAWRALESTLGSPIKTFAVDAAELLRGWGYDTSSIESEDKLRIAIFRAQEHGHPGSLIYCTDGMRSLSLGHRHPYAQPGPGAGAELVLQTPLNSSEPSSASPTLQLPLWPLKPLAAAWLMAQERRPKSLRAGDATELDHLDDSAPTLHPGLLLTQSNLASGELLSPEGPFRLLNLVGITTGEIELITSRSIEHLLALLARRGLDQSYQLRRSCLVTPATKQKRDLPISYDFRTPVVVKKKGSETLNSESTPSVSSESVVAPV